MLYIRFSNQRVFMTQQMCGNAVLVDRDMEDRAVGIEILVPVTIETEGSVERPYPVPKAVRDSF